MSDRVDELRRLVTQAETNAGVEALIAAGREAVGVWSRLRCTTYEESWREMVRLNRAIDRRLEELVGRP